MGSTKELEALIKEACHIPSSVLYDGESEYIRSFAIEEGRDAQEFFAKFGFVVYRDALSAVESAASVAAALELCEQVSDGRFHRRDLQTWCNFPGNKFGCLPRDAAMNNAMLRNRVHPNVFAAFAQLLDDTDLLVNHDHICFQRPTRGSRGKEEWATSSSLHLDVNPWQYMSEPSSARVALEHLRYTSPRDFLKESNVVFASDGPHLQGELNFIDNVDKDGGFWCVPGFSRIFEQVFRNLAMPADAAAMQNFDFGQISTGHDQLSEVMKHIVRVPMRAGSLVIWDQRTPHGMSRNFSARPRIAQSLKLFPRRLVCPARLQRRAAFLRRELQHIGHSNDAPAILETIHEGKCSDLQAGTDLPTCMQREDMWNDQFLNSFIEGREDNRSFSEDRASDGDDVPGGSNGQMDLYASLSSLGVLIVGAVLILV